MFFGLNVDCVSRPQVQLVLLATESGGQWGFEPCNYGYFTLGKKGKYGKMMINMIDTREHTFFPGQIHHYVQILK